MKELIPKQLEETGICQGSRANFCVWSKRLLRGLRKRIVFGAGLLLGKQGASEDQKFAAKLTQIKNRFFKFFRYEAKRSQTFSQIHVFCVLFLFSILSAQKVNGDILMFPDFKTSMLREQSNLRQYLNRKRLYESSNPKYVKLFEDHYNQMVEIVRNDRNDFYRIPRIVHQIWLGSKVPEKYRAWMESWTQLRGWRYMLWTDEEVKNLKMYNRDLYDRSENWGEKSDILRLELLYKYGGLYVDTDFECIREEMFDDLHRMFDFYLGFEPLEHGSTKFNMFKMCNAIIASIPNHPLVHDLIENMRANFIAYRSHTGPIGTTGPSYISRIIFEYMESRADTLRNMFFPSTIFYPFSAIDMENYCNESLNVLPIFPETAAAHYWNMSWTKCAAERNQYNQKITLLPKLELRYVW